MASFISSGPLRATLRMAQRRGTCTSLHLTLALHGANHAAAARLLHPTGTQQWWGQSASIRRIGGSAAAWPSPGGPLAAAGAVAGGAVATPRRRRPGAVGRVAAAGALLGITSLHQSQQPQQRLQLQPQTPHLSRSSLLRAGVLLVGAGSAFSGQSSARGSQAGPASAASAAMSSSTASSPTGAIVVYVTVPSAEVGEALGSKLVESRLAACVNMLPGVTSIYSWKGKVEKDSELLLIIKSRLELLPELTTFVRANHPYEEPEVVGLPILGGSATYLQWLMDSTRGSGQAGAGASAEGAKE